MSMEAALNIIIFSRQILVMTETVFSGWGLSEVSCNLSHMIDDGESKRRAIAGLINRKLVYCMLVVASYPLDALMRPFVSERKSPALRSNLRWLIRVRTTVLPCNFAARDELEPVVLEKESLRSFQRALVGLWKPFLFHLAWPRFDYLHRPRLPWFLLDTPLRRSIKTNSSEKFCRVIWYVRKWNPV